MDALFQVKWKSCDVTWLPYEKTDHLDALSEYFDALGTENVSQLRDSRIPVLGDNDNDVEEVGGIRLSALELDPSQLTKPLRQPLKKRLSVTHKFPSPIPLIPQPLISSLSSLSTMSRTYNTLKYHKDGTVAFEGVLRKDNGMWLLEKVDSLDLYLIMDNELEILVEFSHLLYFSDFYISVTPVPASYPIFCDIVNQANFIVNAAPLPSDSSTHDVHGSVLKLEHFFPTDDPFLTNTIEDQLLSAATNATAWTLEELGLSRTMAKAKVDQYLMAIAYEWQDPSPIIDSKPIFGRYSFGFPSPVQRHKTSTGKGNNLLTPLTST